jgi:hypothetical protein
MMPQIYVKASEAGITIANSSVTKTLQLQEDMHSLCTRATDHRLARFLYEDNFTVINQSDTPKPYCTTIPSVDHHDCIRGQLLDYCYRSNGSWRRAGFACGYHHQCMVLRASRSSSQTEDWS